MIARLVIVALMLLSGNAIAQSTISFTGRDAQSGGTVALDSVYVLSESGSKDTTLIGSMSLDMDWLTSAAPVAVFPEGFQLGTPYPNGFDASTQFDVWLGRRATLTLDVCNTLGKRVAVFERVFESGTQRFRVDAGALAAGVYFLRVSDGRTVLARKLLKLAAPTVSASPSRLFWMGTVVPAGTPMQLISEVGKIVRAHVGSFTFIGYAAGFLPDTLAQVTPSAGQTYEFSFLSEPDARKIRSGRLVDEGGTIIGSSGGVVTIDRPDSPIKGLAISVPSGSYADEREFTVGYAAVEGHELGQYFNPISPLITIGNGGGYSDEVMELTIPVEIPPGHFAMAWLYNERTGEVEALPPIAQDEHSITVMTRHFATSSVSGIGKKTAGGQGPIANVITTSMLESVLTGQNVINTGFQPGKDDWEFVNHGSTIAPKGHCAGQSITAMWYYYEQRLNADPPLPPLYGAYDRVNISPEVLWMDNPQGYRFASVIQEELDFKGRLADLLWKGRDSSYHSLTWKAFGAAMLVTGCPQYVGLTRLKPNGDPDGGHAIIAYKMSFDEGKLFVADPNYPGDLRSIQFSRQDGYYAPYSTKQDADEADARAYQNIGFTAKTALIEWDKVTARWPEFLDKSIGTAGNNAFPEYEIQVAGTNEIVDPEKVIHTAADSIEFTPITFPLRCYTLDGKRAENIPGSWKIPVQPGKNTIGLYTLKDGEFVDFVWVDVERQGYGAGAKAFDNILGSYTHTWVDGQGQQQSETSERNVWLKSYSVMDFYWQSAHDGVLQYDTTINNGSITVTISFSVVLDVKNMIITSLRYDYKYVQGQDWEETSHITAVNIPYDPDYSTDTRDVFRVQGAAAASSIVTLNWSTRRLDAEDAEVLTSYSCSDNTLIAITLYK